MLRIKQNPLLTSTANLKLRFLLICVISSLRLYLHKTKNQLPHSGTSLKPAALKLSCGQTNLFTSNTFKYSYFL